MSAPRRDLRFEPRRARILTTLALSLAAACHADRSLESERYACATSSECQTGYECIAGSCSKDGENGGDPGSTTATDGGCVAAGNCPPPLPSVSTLKDDFDSNSIGANWTSYTIGGTALEVKSGRLEMSFSSAQNGAVGITSKNPYDAMAASSTIQMVSLPSSGPVRIQLIWQAIRDDKHNAWDRAMVTYGPDKVLRAELRSENLCLTPSCEDLKSGALPGVQVLRLRQADSVIAVEYANNLGGPYSTLGQLPVPTRWSLTRIETAVGIQVIGDGSSSNGTVVLDNYNQP